MSGNSAPDESLDSGRSALELRPRCSLTPQGARLFVCVVAGTTFGVAAILALQGFWPVLAFAGFEIALLIWAVRAAMRAGVERETIVVSERWVTITHHDVNGEHRSVFPRHWTKVKLRAPPVALHPSRLMLESHGRGYEVGRFLTEDERRTLAARLTQLVGNVNESPAQRCERG